MTPRPLLSPGRDRWDKAPPAISGRRLTKSNDSVCDVIDECGVTAGRFQLYPSGRCTLTQRHGGGGGERGRTCHFNIKRTARRKTKGGLKWRRAVRWLFKEHKMFDARCVPPAPTFFNISPRYCINLRTLERTCYDRKRCKAQNRDVG